MNTKNITEALREHHYEKISQPLDNIIKCERLYKNRPYAVIYIDVSNNILTHANNIKNYQEQLVGPDFFSPDNSLRWNNYIYFITKPESITAIDKFAAAKSRIESNRHFARKFVLSEEDFIEHIKNTVPTPEKAHNVNTFVNVSSKWEENLHTHALGIILDQKPRAGTLAAIANGSAFRVEPTIRPVNDKNPESPLDSGFLRSLSIGDFRRVNSGRKYRFGDVNLIIGPNGTGKTSLLEAIEAIYCGRIRRDLTATFTGISAELENPDGSLVEVKTPTSTATIKARNMLWYGRADQQANAICQGFTRFNFLDTDAAFRLASSNSEEIKGDVARLLVGAETSRLWQHLSALEKEIKPKIRSSNEQLETLRSTVNSLASEVKRLQEAPSEATVLERSFQTSIQHLRRHNGNDNGQLETNSNDKAWLEQTSRSITELLNALPGIDVTASQAKAYIEELGLNQTELHRIALDHANTSKQVEACEKSAKKLQAETAAIDEWKHFLLADVPQLAAALSAEDDNISLWTKQLKGQFSEDVEAGLATEYLSLSVADALQNAQARFDAAKEQRHFASTALEKARQLGQSLDSLRRDLHDASLAFISKSGNASRCPVCQTDHEESHLLSKLDALVSSSNEHISTGLRNNLNIAEQNLFSCQANLHSLDLLKSFCEQTSEPLSQMVSKAHDRRRKMLLDFQAASSRRQDILKALETLAIQGFNWKEWPEIKATAVRHLPQESDVHDRHALEEALQNCEAMRHDAVQQSTAARERLEQLHKSAMVLTSKYIHANLSQLPIANLEGLLQRKHAEVARALEKISKILVEIGAAETTPLEELRSEIEACVLLHDRARSARQIENTAQSELQNKLQQLASANSKLDEERKVNENLARAQQVLSHIIENHSLDQATSMAFNAIKDRVSNVFARIHSPHEYELGDFSQGQLLVTRNDKQAREPHQVSTGQRAALALSIFLALNESASTAPPVILIDDPVAHIDDLNALSFLDYLRELVVWNKKQVFFATADIRLAALFERKFDFLGDRFRRINITDQQY